MSVHVGPLNVELSVLLYFKIFANSVGMKWFIFVVLLFIASFPFLLTTLLISGQRGNYSTEVFQYYINIVQLSKGTKVYKLGSRRDFLDTQFVNRLQVWKMDFSVTTVSFTEWSC